MRYFITLLVFVIIGIVIFVVLAKKKIKLTRPKKLLIVLAWLATFSLALYPFEGTITEFDSPGQALRYSSYNETICEQINVPGGAFLICNVGEGNSSTTVHSIEKHAEKWGMIGLHEEQKLINSSLVVPSSDTLVFESVTFIGSFTYNQNFHKTLIDLSGTFHNIPSVSIKDMEGNAFTVYASKENMNGIYTLNMYLVLDGGIPKEMEIYINDVKVKIK